MIALGDGTQGPPNYWRSNHWATKPRQEQRANSRHSPSWVRSPGGATLCFFSSDPAVSFSILVGEKGEKLITNLRSLLPVSSLIFLVGFSFLYAGLSNSGYWSGGQFPVWLVDGGRSASERRLGDTVPSLDTCLCGAPHWESRLGRLTCSQNLPILERRCTDR